MCTMHMRLCVGSVHLRLLKHNKVNSSKNDYMQLIQLLSVCLCLCKHCPKSKQNRLSQFIYVWMRHAFHNGCNRVRYAIRMCVQVVSMYRLVTHSYFI